MARQYDMILLAPQIAYLESKILTKFHGDVYSIPPKMFATNDYNEIVEFILKHNKFTILNKWFYFIKKLLQFWLLLYII